MTREIHDRKLGYSWVPIRSPSDYEMAYLLAAIETSGQLSKKEDQDWLDVDEIWS